MSRVTRFAARDPGPAARVSGFLAHLRENGLRLGVAETELALTALTQVDAAVPVQSKRALRAVCTGCREDADRFDDLFDSFWLNGGRVKQKIVPSKGETAKDHVHSSRVAQGAPATGAGEATAPDGGSGASEGDGLGKLMATEVTNLMKKDLRDLVRPEDILAAERVALRLGAALRDRRSRRRKAARKGDRLHFRRVIRQSLATGGQPFDLPKKHRPDRLRKIAAICDVSGSMSVYAQVFLAFLAGLMRADQTADAYLFHTRLVRITHALRDRDALRALARMSLMADGFAGGSKISHSIGRFADTHAKRFVDGRTVVLILSDGFDTDPPAAMSAALSRLRKRGCKVIWLNPLKGWRDYEATAQGMAAALPYIDLFKAANTLEELAGLEPELVRL
ncbi:VWA domain-containing protein [Roseobacter sp. YSTF-M11]|uniref:VWA domain-containing protein n=1 Tax=Roseobacter insulae TaxID=2859783 RepID=A0A9X1K0G2_9RHOB|nr:VWA domain-containing protein [Roseobacter insulae]MBW4710205.1 VWA domain-containing protein [Roseobacter insulae]